MKRVPRSEPPQTTTFSLPPLPSLADDDFYRPSRRGRRPRRGVYARSVALAALVAVPFGAILYDNASYGETSRYTLAIATWVLVAIVYALGSALPRLTAVQLTAAAALAALGLWSFLSATWGGGSAELAVGAGSLCLFYVGVLLLTWALAPLLGPARWLDGLGLAALCVLVGSLASRFFPGLFPDQGLAVLIPNESSRLSFPLGYWNGLAILAAVAVPLFGRWAVDSPRPSLRFLAAASMPAAGSVVYLTSSRTGTVASVVALVSFVALSGDRWRALLFVGVGGAGAAVMVARLSALEVLDIASIDGPAARSQERESAFLLILVGLLTGASYLAATRVLEERLRPGRRVALALIGVAAVLAVGALVASNPVERLDQFKSPIVGAADADYVQGHLSSASGNGRWQLWAEAVDQWREHPVAGGGGGSYERWWLEHGSLPLFVRNAHSLYLETLGELGIVGLGLLAAALGALAVGAVRAAARARTPQERGIAAAGAAAFAAFLAAGLADWVWQLPALTAFALAAVAGTFASPTGAARRTATLGLRVGVTAAALAATAFLLTPWLAALRLESSREHAAAGQWQLARTDAERAFELVPWATTPRTQLALLDERRSRNRVALAWINRALDTDGGDWRLWFIRGRIYAALDARPEALASFERAVSLNPRSVALTQARDLLARTQGR